MTTMSSIERYPIDTVSDNKVWVMMRRVHFHISDLVANQLHRRMIATTDRRILDALDYADISGLSSVSVSTLCAMVPILLRPQTAGSALVRLSERDLVDRADVEESSNHWQLTDRGHETRIDYGREVEQLLSRLLGPDEDPLTEILLHQAGLATGSMNDRLLPVLEFAGGLDAHAAPEPSTGWSALRRIHFYIDDLIYREIEPFGVGRVERRVLDSLGYARKHGIIGGLNVGTICRLNEAVSRQVVETALARMAAQHWVVKHIDPTKKVGSRLRQRWDLTAKGETIRETYKRYAQVRLREVIDLDEDHRASLLELARRAHHHRDSRCLPVIDYFQRTA